MKLLPFILHSFLSSLFIMLSYFLYNEFLSSPSPSPLILLPHPNSDFSHAHPAHMTNTHWNKDCPLGKGIKKKGRGVGVKQEGHYHENFPGVCWARKKTGKQQGQKLNARWQTWSLSGWILKEDPNRHLSLLLSPHTFPLFLVQHITFPLRSCFFYTLWDW